MKPYKNKKGFTIVELVIVIAVIGILAAILIPTFVNLTAQANRVSNESFVKNINTQLAMDEAQGKKSANPFEALAKAEKMGFLVDEITPYEGNDIIYDEINDRYAIVKSDFASNPNMEHVVFADASFNPATPLHKLWKFYDAMPTSPTYSIAAKKNWNVENVTNLKVGFDAGKSTTVKSISYDGDKSVIIRTNTADTTLTIDNENAIVYHYGYAGSVEIKQVAPSSYHENGSVGFLEIANGRVALEKGAEVGRIHLNATAGNFNNITVAKAPEVELPTFSRDPVEIPTETGKLVVALQENTDKDAKKDYVWLTAVGVYEQVTVSNSNSQAGQSYAAESGSETQKTAAAQIANNITATIGEDAFTVKATKDGSSWTYSLVDSNGTEANYQVTDVALAVDTSGEEVSTTANVTVTGSTATAKADNGISETEKKDAKAEAIDELAGEEVAEDPKADSYVARIGTKGYESFKAAVNAAAEGQKIFLLKDCTINEDIGDLTSEGWVNGLKNEVVLTKDITIIFEGAYQLQFNEGGSINTNGHQLKLGATTAGAGLFLVDIDEDLETAEGASGVFLTIIGHNLQYIFTEEEKLTLKNLVKFDGEKWKTSSQIAIGAADMEEGEEEF